MRLENKSEKNRYRHDRYLNIQLLFQYWYNTNRFTENFQAKNPMDLIGNLAFVNTADIIRGRRFQCLDN